MRCALTTRSSYCSKRRKLKEQTTNGATAPPPAPRQAARPCYDAHILHWDGETPLTQNSKSDTPSSFLFIENRMFFMFILNCIKYKVKIRLSINIVEPLRHHNSAHTSTAGWQTMVHTGRHALVGGRLPAQEACCLLVLVQQQYLLVATTHHCL